MREVPVREIPEWATTDHPFVGRHVTCGEIHYEVLAVDSDFESTLLVRHNLHELAHILIISMDQPTNWFFVNVLDEIVKATN